LAAALLAALVWILRLLARRLIRILAGLSGLMALSILLTILVGIILFVITSPQWSETYDNRAYGGSFRQIKKKAAQFKCGRLFAIIATFAFSYPLVLSDTSNICIPYSGKACCRLRHCACSPFTPIYCISSHEILRLGRETEFVKCQLY
jgi:hypothetical protein